jgi:hypothetical protein
VTISISILLSSYLYTLNVCEAWNFSYLGSVSSRNVAPIQYSPEIMQKHLLNPEIKSPSMICSTHHLAFGNVESNWAWVVVLEEGEAGSRGRGKLVRESLASWAGEGGDNRGGSRGNTADTEVGQDASPGGVGSGTGGDSAQLREVNVAVAGEGV